MSRWMIGTFVAASCLIGVVWAQGEARKALLVRHAPLPNVNATMSTNWSDHNGDPANTRYSPLDQINASNVDTLVLKWTHDVPRSELIREQTPLVIDGVMYVSSGSKLRAIDAATGTPVWSFDLEPSIAPPFLGKRGPSYAEGRIYSFGATDSLRSRREDGNTGGVVWRGRRASHHREGAPFEVPGEVPSRCRSVPNGVQHRRHAEVLQRHVVLRHRWFGQLDSRWLSDRRGCENGGD